MWLSHIYKKCTSAKVPSWRFLMKIPLFTAVEFSLCNIPQLTNSFIYYRKKQVVLLCRWTATSNFINAVKRQRNLGLRSWLLLTFWYINHQKIKDKKCINVFYLRLLITPLVSSSFDYCIACSSIYVFWLPLWYLHLLSIVLSSLLFTSSHFPFSFFIFRK
jgi:hypothetical protein